MDHQTITGDYTDPNLTSGKTIPSVSANMHPKLKIKPYSFLQGKHFYTEKIWFTAGKKRVENNGLYYYGARYYAAWIGRWTAVDPMANQRVTFNPYNYCQNNPINRTDPTGALDDDPPVAQATATREHSATDVIEFKEARRLQKYYEGKTIRPSKELLNDKVAMEAYFLWEDSEAGKKFQSLYGEGGKYEDIEIEVGINEKRLKGAKGNTYVVAVDSEGKERSMMKLGSKLKEGESLKFYIDFSHPGETKAGTKGLYRKEEDMYKDNFPYEDYISGVLPEYWTNYINFKAKVNKASTIIHETQHIQLIHRDYMTHGKYVTDPQRQHIEMKDKSQKWYWERYNIYKQYLPEITPEVNSFENM